MKATILNLSPAQSAIVFPRTEDALFPDETARTVGTTRITCRVCGLRGESNPQAVLLCGECLSDLDQAARTVAVVYAAAIARLWAIDAAFAEVVDGSVWWEKVQAARIDPNVSAASFQAAWEAARTGPHAPIVAAWERHHTAYTEALAAHDRESARYRAAEAELKAARAAGYGVLEVAA